MAQDQPTMRGGSRRSHGGAPRSTRRRLLVIGAAVLLLGAVVVGTVSVMASDGSSGCTGTTRHLAVVATPEMAPVVTQVARTAGRTDGKPCWVADVTAVRSADALVRFRATVRPDVWLPDSSAWTRPSLSGELPLPEAGASVASSPVVLAAPAALAARVPGGDAVDLRRDVVSVDGAALPLALPDPASSAASLALLVQVEAALGGGTRGRLDEARLVRAAVRDMPTSPADALAAAMREQLVVPVSEQALSDYNDSGPPAPAKALRIAGTGAALDYPYVVLARDAPTRSVADALSTALRGGDVRRILEDHGLRAPAGTAGPSAGVLDATLRTYEALTRDSRLLAVVDVSGSMRAPVPGAGGASRIQLVRDAAQEGLNVYPDGAHIGLWEFATDLAPDRDYRELVAIGPLTARPGGTTGRQELGRALDGIEATRGDTGLYDTTLAAVRAVRSGWDPRRANVVVLLSDGRNEDARGLTLDRLLTSLRQENDPRRPVPVVTIAYGPDTDDSAMAAISAATGGVLYRSPDPRRIGEVFFDAIARRPCLPAC